jgi:hypothetical protein|tara:strand:+ start:262 stop:708 length:447 start_codon:yes stop_codon:yes gene_type:complete
MATLKVKIQEDIILGNQDYGSKRTLEISSIDEIYKRVVTCPASQTTTIAVFNSNAYGAAGAVDIEDSKYIRVTNLDGSNSVELAVVGAATLYQVKLGAGESHILGSADDLMLSEADTSPSFGTMADLGSIQVNPGGNAVSVELFIASA